MLFTKEQIEEIALRLSVMGIKDSDMEELNTMATPLNGTETVVIVKDGRNVRIPIEYLMSSGWGSGDIGNMGNISFEIDVDTMELYCICNNPNIGFELGENGMLYVIN